MAAVRRRTGRLRRSRAVGASARRVVIVVQNLSVPFDRRVWQEATTLRDAGYDIRVICPKGTSYDEEPYSLLEDVEIFRYDLRPATAGISGYPREYAVSMASTWRLLRRLYRERPFGLLHACNPPDILLLAGLPFRSRGTCMIFDHHDLVPELYLSRFPNAPVLGHAATLRAEQLTFRLADVVLSTNESYRRVAIQRGGADPDRVFVVRSAPDLRAFQPVSPDCSLRRGSEHLIAYVGVMGPQDGIDHALRALAGLSRRRADWHAVFVGSGDVFEQMHSLRDELGLRESVTFTGRVPDSELLRILSTADVALSPDPRNPLNDASTMNKIMEYMALGLPIASYDLTETRVSAGDAAMYATPNAPDALASVVDVLLSSPRTRAAMADAGRARVRDDLSWERSAEALLRAYARAEAVVSARRPASYPAVGIARHDQDSAFLPSSPMPGSVEAGSGSAE